MHGLRLSFDNRTLCVPDSKGTYKKGPAARLDLWLKLCAVTALTGTFPIVDLYHLPPDPNKRSLPNTFWDASHPSLLSTLYVLYGAWESFWTPGTLGELGHRECPPLKCDDSNHCVYLFAQRRWPGRAS